MRFSLSVVKVAINVADKTFRFVDYLNLIDIAAPGFTGFQGAQLQADAVESMKEHIQSFHTSTQRKVRSQVVAIARHLPTGEPGKVRRIPYCQILQYFKVLLNMIKFLNEGIYIIKINL